MRLQSWTCRSLLAALGLLMMSTALHADRKVFPATICHVWEGHWQYLDYIVYSKFGRVENRHPTKRLAVVCPIPRDNLQHSANWISVAYWDRDYNGGSSGQLACSLSGNDIFGTHSKENLWRSTNASGGRYFGTWYFYHVDTYNDDRISAPHPGTYTLFCWLPPAFRSDGSKPDGTSKDERSSIGAIVIDEP